MKIEKFQIISSIALAGIGFYLTQKGFKDTVDVLKSNELNMLDASIAGAEMAISAVLFNNAIKKFRSSFNKEEDLLIREEKLIPKRKM
jgi:hypothetical protein